MLKTYETVKHATWQTVTSTYEIFYGKFLRKTNETLKVKKKWTSSSKTMKVNSKIMKQTVKECKEHSSHSF